MKSKSEKVNEQMEIGNIGEDIFCIEFVPTIKSFYNKKIVDLRGTLLEKDNDIDFLLVPLEYTVDINNLEWQEKIKNELTYHTEDSLKNAEIFAIEIKTDKKSYKTNRLVYDITSHDKRGGCARSLCDFLFYVVIDDNNNACNYYFFNMFKLRRYIREHCEEINKTKNFFLLNFKDDINETDSKSLLLLINFNILVKNKIGKKYNVYGTF